MGSEQESEQFVMRIDTTQAAIQGQDDYDESSQDAKLRHYRDQIGVLT